MIDWFAIATGLGAGLFGLGLGRVWGERVDARRSALDLERQQRQADRAIAEQREEVQRLSDELDRLRTRAAVSLIGSLPSDPAPERPTARALARFTARVRGAATVSDAVVMQPDGLPATTCDDAHLRRAATLVADLGPLCDLHLPGFVSLSVELRGRDPITFRLLPDWTRGAWLVVAGKGGPVNGPALDGAIIGAYRGQRQVPPSRALVEGVAEPGSDWLASDVGLAFRSAAVITDGQLSAYGNLGGPSRLLMGNMVPGLCRLWARVAYWCGEPLSIRLDNPHGEWLVYCPVDGRRDIAVIGEGPVVDELAFERLRGRVRRLAAREVETGDVVAVEEAS